MNNLAVNVFSMLNRQVISKATAAKAVLAAEPAKTDVPDPEGEETRVRDVSV